MALDAAFHFPAAASSFLSAASFFSRAATAAPFFSAIAGDSWWSVMPPSFFRDLASFVAALSTLRSAFRWR